MGTSCSRYSRGFLGPQKGAHHSARPPEGQGLLIWGRRGPRQVRGLTALCQWESQQVHISACCGYRICPCPHSLWITLWMDSDPCRNAPEKDRGLVFRPIPSQFEKL